MFSIATDYVTSFGEPAPYLERIAEAGFSHVHWGHQWNTDFLYSRHEISHIYRELTRNRLSVIALHASRGKEKNWGSSTEYKRLAGVELIKNRLVMAARLSCSVAVLHIPPAPDPMGSSEEHFITRLTRSLDDVAPFARRHGVCIALENRCDDDFVKIRALTARYGPEYMGLCYDSGHGNIGGRGLKCLEEFRDRVIAVHLHDNLGQQDDHNLPFTGTIDWARLTDILARSSYQACVNLEVSIRKARAKDETKFLVEAYRSAESLNLMLVDRHNACRAGGPLRPESPA